MENQENQINIQAEISKFLVHWYWIVLSVIISLVCGYVYFTYQSEVYQTGARIKILDHSNNNFRLPSEGVSIFSRGKINLENEIEVMRSAEIVGKVVDSLNLTTQIHAKGLVKYYELWRDKPISIDWIMDKDSLNNREINFEIEITKKGYKILNSKSSKELKFENANYNFPIPFKLNLNKNRTLQELSGNIYKITLNRKDPVVKNYSSSFGINLVGKQSDILGVSLTGTNSDKIADVVNTLIVIFNQDGIKDRQLVSRRTIEFVNQRFEKIFSELDAIETGIADDKRDNEFMEFGSVVGKFTGKYEDLTTEVERINDQIVLSGMLFASIEKSKDLEVFPNNVGVVSSDINGLIAAYNEQVLKRKRLLVGAGESNPLVKEATDLAFVIKNNIKTSILDYKNYLIENKNKFVDVRKADAREAFSFLPYKEKDIRNVERERGVKESLFLILLQKREEAAINLSIVPPTIKIVENAVKNPTPISPQKKNIYLVALAIGFIVPLGIIYLTILLDNKLHYKVEIEKQLPTIPVIAEIPFIDSDNKTIRYFDRSVLSEAFRILRTNLNFLTPISDKGAVFFVTSCIKGEGKTFVSLNLAITLSALNKKIILVGADLRNPQLHKSFNIKKSNYKGVANYLSNSTISIEEITVKGLVDKMDLDVIFSGTLPPNPAELLSNGRFELLLNELKEKYDYIVVDTAPSLLVADTTLITDLADAILFVTRANFTEKRLLSFIKELKEMNKIKNMGIIFNNVGSKKGYGYGYSYKYNYNYGYDYGYMNENDEKPKKSLATKVKIKVKKLRKKLFK
jgi:capsular exopolysaccharide synthesis family protein